MDLKNKVAIVTGGGSGLGEATAIKLAEGGAKVAVLDLNGDAANAVAERIGGRAFAIDITDAEAGETTVATIASDLEAIRQAGGTTGFRASPWCAARFSKRPLGEHCG
jgi:NAD(P)-dependent dehydrogenase (short-subunit alcohol dehydrogenase family)